MTRSIGDGSLALRMRVAGLMRVIAVPMMLALTPAQAADQALIDAAKKEGAVTWYTTLIVNQMARPAVDAFEKKYGIAVNYIRNDSQDIMLRVLNEAKSGKVLADIYDGVSGVGTYKRENLLEKWLPDVAKTLPKEFFDKDGYWIGTSLYLQAFSYNTDLVKKGDEPKTLQDLLDPKWKGQMAISGSSSTTGVGGFVGHVVTKMGEEKGVEYLKKLALQKPAVLQVSTRQVMDQVIAGEYQIGVQTLTHHAAFSSSRGAPVEWVPTEDAMGSLLILGLFKGPHPNAGKLLIDFLMSDEGQTLFREADYIPVAPNVQARQARLKPDGVNFRARIFTPEEIDAGQPGWMKIFQETLK